MFELFKYLKKYKNLFTFSCIASIFNKILDLMPPILVGWVIDTVARNPPDWIKSLVGVEGPFNTALLLSILGFAIFAFESLFQWMYQYGFMNLAQNVQHELRVDSYDHIQHREMEFFENHRLGETMAMLNDDVNQLERFLNGGFNDILQLIVLFIFSGFVLFGTSTQLALVGLLPIPIIIWGSLFYQRAISPRYTGVRKAVGDLSSRLENNISGIAVVKSFTAEDFELNRVNQASLDYKNANYKAIKLGALYVPAIRFAVAFGFAGVLLLGSYWVLEDTGVLTVGELVLFSMLIQRLLWPLTRLGTTLDEFERAKASAKRTFGLLKSHCKITDAENPKTLQTLKCDVDFENLSFMYGNNIKVLDNINFSIKNGQTIGVAGSTGAGKSTLVKMLLRFYDPYSGVLKINGINIKDISLNSLRKSISLVSQDVYLFHGTIFDNIAYSNKNMTLEDVLNASTLASFHDFVMTLPEGYQTIVGERGIKLSGGQRQRLSIARALLKNAPIMVYDEATSSVDTETERAIQQNLSSFTKGKTALIIAHRLSTIVHADHIIVLKEAKIIEEGTHEELIHQQGVYADLWAVQSGKL